MLNRRGFLGSTIAAVGLPAFTSLPGLPRSIRYVPGAAPAKPIRLSSNENPLGMADSARQAILDSMVDGNRYPRIDNDLMAAIAAKHGVRPGNVVLGAGSTDVLRMAVQAVAAPDARVVLPDPTFEHVEAYARPFIRDIVKVPLTAAWAMDLDAMLAAARAAKGPALVFICNPNNPTGTITSCDDVESMIRGAPERITFVVDEAYFDFVADPHYRTLTGLIGQPNVVVSRTFSKVYGLAGLRAGYGMAAESTVGRMKAVAIKNTINHFAGVAILASIDDQAFMKKSIDVNQRGRAVVKRTLTELEIEALPSHTNFVMHRIKGDHAAYSARMAEAGLQVGRAFPPMVDHNRVSIGTPEQMEVWAEALTSFRSRGWI